ncbi:MAG: oligoribonuclease [Gammaproteobacteria bacterium]|nr:oligoribonuclease [Gammaproteobacteria bacterium]
MTQSAEHLIWIDLEMTGLLPDTDRIIEIATVVSDKHLSIVAEGPVLAVHQPDEVLGGMDEWNTKQHSKSGLIDRVKGSSIDEREAESKTLQFLEAWVPAGVSPMCGNSICQDRRFLARYMPELEKFFHYRNLDVSTLKELAKRWAPDISFTKESVHLALDDIKDSIEELAYYRDHFIRMDQ